MSVNRLVVTIEATQQSLQLRLDEATQHATDRSRPRAAFARIDAFLAATSRHLAAAEEVLVRVAEDRLPDGEARVSSYLHQARLLELAIAQVKARLYGEQHAAYRPWPEVWDDIRRELLRHNELERGLVEDLAVLLDEEACDALAERVYRAEVKAPTRAHPYLPHTGIFGRVARRVWALADRFWDLAEGRAVPAVVRPRPKDTDTDSLMSQYLRGEPLLDDKAPMFGHRRHRG